MASHWFLKKIPRYYLKRKEKDAIEFEEGAPFPGAGADRISTGGEKINRHSVIAEILSFGFILILLMQTFRLQIMDKNKFSVLAENNRLKEITFNADRGIIYDKNKNILARNEAIFDLVGTGKEIPQDGDILAALAEKIALLTGKKEDEIGNALKNLNSASYRPELLLENIGIAAAIRIEAEKDKMPGVETRKNAIRSYPDAKYFSEIIGYTGRVSPDDLRADSVYEPADFIGKDGLEAFYEQKLRGKKGVEKSEVNAIGKIVSLLSKTDPEDGKNLILSVDGNLQKKLQDALQAQMKKISGLPPNSGAAAVAMDPRNGKIMALVSLPSYDNNVFADPSNKDRRLKILNDSSFPMFNRVISGVYPPGSTIKPVMGIAGLSEGVIDKNTIIEDRGVIIIPNPYYPDQPSTYYGWNRGGLGPMNIISAIAQSSDIYFYTLGGGFGKFIGLGVDRIVEYFRKFNLGKKLGIDLPGESDGFVPTSEWKLEKYDDPWRIGNTYHLSIGQSYLLTTPLQVASWTEVMANGGTLYKPQVVDKITSGEHDEIIQDIPSEIIKSNIADAKDIDIVRRGMREAVLNGSARALASLPISVAGKTGTAQYGTKGLAHAWFTSFAPYDNPEIVLTILIEGGGEGGMVSVPVAKEVLGWYFEEKEKISAE
jgi:penicillin-binding protein 2